jgi:hypothetical protein
MKFEWRMDLKAHVGITQPGIDKFKSIFGTRKVRVIESDKDVPYNIDASTHQLQSKQHASLLSTICHLKIDLLSFHLEELLYCSSMVNDQSKQVKTSCGED